MGKTSLCIQMLEILNTGRQYQIGELAALLDTNPRNIIEYRKELQECGYYIISVPGVYGGYYLDKSHVIPSIKLTDNEKDIISEGIAYINSRNDYPNKTDFMKCMGRVMSSIEHNFVEDPLVINHYPLIMDEVEIKERYNKLQEAIKYKNVVKIKYESQKKKEQEYIYHPYELFMYNNSWFVIGWNENINNVTYLRLNRINSIEIINKKFKIWKSYNRNNYLDEFGFKNNGEWYHIEFVAKNNYAQLCKERIYGKNQEIDLIDDKHTLVKVDMQNKESIVQFILGFNKDVEVIKPEWLKEELKEYAGFILEEYK